MNKTVISLKLNLNKWFEVNLNSEAFPMEVSETGEAFLLKLRKLPYPLWIKEGGTGVLALGPAEPVEVVVQSVSKEGESFLIKCVPQKTEVSK